MADQTIDTRPRKAVGTDYATKQIKDTATNAAMGAAKSYQFSKFAPTWAQGESRQNAAKTLAEGKAAGDYAKRFGVDTSEKYEEPFYHKNIAKRQQGEMKASGMDKIDSYKKGGMVKRTGPAKLHKGERVLTTKQAKSYRRAK